MMSKDAAQLRVETLTLWDGRSLPGGLGCELEREVERLALVERQISALEAERRERLREPKTDAERSIVQLMRLGAIGVSSVVNHNGRAYRQARRRFERKSGRKALRPGQGL